MNKFMDQAKETAEEMNIRAAQAVLKKTLRALDEKEEEIRQTKKDQDKEISRNLVIGILGAALTAAVVAMSSVAVGRQIKQLAEENKAEQRRLEFEKNKELFRQLSVIKGKH